MTDGEARVRDRTSSRTTRRPRPGRRPGRARRSRPDGRLDGCRGAGRDARRPARSTSTRGRATGCGARARRAGNVLRLVDLAIDCDGDALLSRSTRSARPAIAGRASLLRCRRRARPSRRPRASPGSRRSGRRSRRAPPNARPVPTRLAARRRRRRGRPQGHRGGDRGPDRRQGRRRGQAQATARPATPSPARPPTCCTTRWSCWPSAICPRRGHRGPARPPRRLTSVGPAARRSRADACRCGRPATPRRSVPGRKPGSVDPPPVDRHAATRDHPARLATRAEDAAVGQEHGRPCRQARAVNANPPAEAWSDASTAGSSSAAPRTSPRNRGSRRWPPPRRASAP